MLITTAEARRLGLTAKPKRKTPQTGTQPPKQEKEPYNLPRPADATHRLKRGIGTWFTNPPLVGSWARITGQDYGRVSLYVWSNDGGGLLMDCTPERFAEWFAELEQTNDA